MTKISIEVNENLLDEVNIISDKVGLDIQSAITVMLKRVVRENGFSFLFDSKPAEVTSLAENQGKEERKEVKFRMTKNRAIALLKNEDVSFNNNITFASKNKSSYNYWANPSFDVLKSDWFLILNDWIRREIHLFEIPAGTFGRDRLIARADKDKIDLQIMHDDPLFTDARSKISFLEFLKASISY